MTIYRYLFTLAINNHGIKRECSCTPRDGCMLWKHVHSFSAVVLSVLMPARAPESSPHQSCFWGMHPSISTTSGQPSYLFVSLLFFMCCWNTIIVVLKTSVDCLSAITQFSVFISLTLCQQGAQAPARWLLVGTPSHIPKRFSLRAYT